MKVTVCIQCRERLDDGATYCIPCWVRESCERQGVPVKVTDSLVLRRVVTLLTGRAH